MRTRFSPRCTSSSAMPLSLTTLISSRISSIVMRSALEFPQLLRCGGQDFASCFRHHHCVLDPYAAEPFEINARFDRDGHSLLQPCLVLLPQPRRHVNLQAQAVPSGVHESFIEPALLPRLPGAPIN